MLRWVQIRLQSVNITEEKEANKGNCLKFMDMFIGFYACFGDLSLRKSRRPFIGSYNKEITKRLCSVV